MTIAEKDLGKAAHIASVQTESKVLLERVLDDLNALKHKTYSKELSGDVNTVIELLEKHKEAFSFYNIQKSIIQELSLNE